MRHKGYTGTSEYSFEDGCYHGQIAFIRDLITYEGESLEELETAFKEAVERYLEYCEETGRPANIDYSQACKIAQRILEQAEQRRIDFADLEASRGIHYGN
jgi:predicted HicB family RNase H-like nuclease